jgi:hypothetical protein
MIKRPTEYDHILLRDLHYMTIYGYEAYSISPYMVMKLQYITMYGRDTYLIR